MRNALAKLYQSPQTVITTKDLALIWQETDHNKLKTKAAYYVKQGALIRLTRGVFAKNKNYNSKELAVSIYTPSYISFETVLREAGMIFQHYDTIFVAGPWSKAVKIGAQRFAFRKLKNSVLYNTAGIINMHNYSIATPERAFLDMIYLFPKYYFDNLNQLDWERCFELVTIYENQQLVRRLKKYRQDYAE